MLSALSRLLPAQLRHLRLVSPRTLLRWHAHLVARRAVRFLAAEAGIRQFLDIGTGLPTASNTHQVAQGIDPAARVVYVDNDPLVLTHARALLVGAVPGAVAYLVADAHRPERILHAAADTLDFTRPVALMLLGILNFILDTAEANRIVADLVAAVPPGSYLTVTHPTLELGGEGNAAAMAFWNEHATPPITARTRAEFAGFFTGLQVLEPGIVSCTRWRPEPGILPAEIPHYGAVARKP